MSDHEIRPARRAMRRVLVEQTMVAAEPKEHPSDPAFAGLAAAGSALWLDTGDIEAAGNLWSTEMEALTTNNTLLNAEIQKGLYDEEVPAVAASIREAEPGIPTGELVREVALYLNARHGLKLVESFGARVSVELHTDLAQEVEETVATGRFLHSLFPDRFIVKVPFTAAGVLATRRLAAAGVPVNHTLGFSARQNLVIAAIARPAFVNVFLGRLNAYTAANDLGDGRLVGEKATWASQRQVLWLREQGWPTRQIAASIRSGEQLPVLAGVDVQTIPPKAAAAYRENPAASPTSGLERELEIDLAGGVDPDREGLTGLWRVEEGFRQGLMRVAMAVTDEWTPARLEEELRRVGGGAIFPAWEGTELEALAAAGKAPERARWADDIEAGRKGLDALFTRAGLLAFAKDQAALDKRVRGLLD